MKKILEKAKMFKLLTGLSCALVIMLMPQKVMAANTSIGSATPISFDRSYSDTFASDIDTRYYKIVLPSSGMVSFYVEGEGNRSVWKLYIYDSNAKQLYYNDYYENKATNKFTIGKDYYLTGGTYYFSIYGGSNANGNYQLKTSFASANESFPETGDGSDNYTGVANPVSVGTTYRGQIANNDDIDYYKFSIPTSGKTSIYVEGTNSGLGLSLYDIQGNKIDYKYVYNDSVTNKVTINLVNCLIAGTYYISMGNDYRPGNYQFTINYTSSNESFVETGKDDYLSGANPINFNTTYWGQIADNWDDVDFYAFQVAQNDTLQINVTAEKYGMVYIYNSEGKQLWSERITSQSSTENYSVSKIVNIAPGTYYFCMSPKWGNYSFEISSYNTTSKPSKVSLSSVKSTKKKTMTVKWKKVNGANGYQIQYARKKNFKGKKTITLGSSASKKTIKKLSSKKRYYVRVRAYKLVAGKYKYGSWSKVKSVDVK